MDRQRTCALILLKRQQNNLAQQIQQLSPPLIIGLALVGGFVAQRLSRTRVPSRAFNLLLSWRKLS